MYFWEEDYLNYGNKRLEDAIGRWRPGAFETFKSAAEESFLQYNTLGYLGAGLAAWTAPNQTPIEEDSWNEEHLSYRPGINYQEDMTEGEALVLATQWDQKTRLQNIRKNVDFWSLPNLAGTMLGALPDPVNLAGFGGFVGRMGTVSKIAKTMPVVKYTAPVLQGASDTALAESLFQFTRATYEHTHGGNLDQFSIFGEIALATAFGGIFGTLPMAWQIAKKIPPAMHFTYLDEAMHRIGRQQKSNDTFGDVGIHADDIDVDAGTALGRNSDRQADTELEGQLADVDEAGAEIYDFERYDFDEVPEVEGKGILAEAADDIHTTLTHPKETKRNIAEKLVECVRFFGRAGKKGI
tara:strand:- start:10702 stop:11760 length:1059 start_codon:yes stop_codon:yes gene_type:complete